MSSSITLGTAKVGTIKSSPSALERAYARLFEEISATVDYLIDYHNAQTGSISFVIHDRALEET
jgi:hypothetical protein